MSGYAPNRRHCVDASRITLAVIPVLHRHTAPSSASMRRAVATMPPVYARCDEPAGGCACIRVLTWSNPLVASGIDAEATTAEAISRARRSLMRAAKSAEELRAGLGASSRADGLGSARGFRLAERRFREPSPKVRHLW